MCLAPGVVDDGSRDGSSKGSRDVVDAVDEAFVNAPAADDPACFLHVDAVPCRVLLETWVDDLRAQSGSRPLTAAMYRRRRAHEHRDRATEFVQRCLAGESVDDDPELPAAMQSGLIGSCAYCGCNFCVVPVARSDKGRVCRVCRRLVRFHNPAPLLRVVSENAEERWKGWLPW